MPERDWRRLFASRISPLDTPFIEDVSGQESETRPLPKVEQTEQLIGRLCVVKVKALLPHYDYNTEVSSGSVDQEKLDFLSEDTKKHLGIDSEIKKTGEASLGLKYNPDTSWIKLDTGRGAVKFVLHSQDQRFCEILAEDEDGLWQRLEVDEEIAISDAKSIIDLIEESAVS